jgi:hypothetical protein
VKRKLRKLVDNFQLDGGTRAMEMAGTSFAKKRLVHVTVEQFKKDMVNATEDQKKDNEYVIRFYERKFQAVLDGVDIIGRMVISRR